MKCIECGSNEKSFDERLGEMTCSECGLVLITGMFEETVSMVSQKGDFVHSGDNGKLGSAQLKSRLSTMSMNYAIKTKVSPIDKGVVFCNMLLSNFSPTPYLKQRAERIYSDVYKTGKFHNNTLEERACAVIYYLLRENGTPVSYHDVCKVEFQSNQKKVKNLAKKIMKHYGNSVLRKPISHEYMIEKITSSLTDDKVFYSQVKAVHDFYEPIIESSYYNRPPTYYVALCWIASNCNLRKDISCSLISRKSGYSRTAIRDTTNALLALIGKKHVKEIKGKELK